jgi:flagellar FliL protein
VVGTQVAATAGMSDDPAPAKAADPPAASSSKAVLGLLVMNLGVTAFVAFKLLTAHPAEAAPAPAHPVEVGSPNEVTGPVVALDPFVVNLDEPGQSRYLKVTLQVEVAPKSEEALAKSKELIRDTVLSYFSGLHVKDTLGAEAKEKIRTDLLAKMTKMIGPDRVRRLFFQDFMVQ